MRIPITIAGCTLIMTIVVMIFCANINTTIRTNEIQYGMEDAVDVTVLSLYKNNYFDQLNAAGYTRTFYPFGDETELVIEKDFDSVLIAINQYGYIEITSYYNKSFSTSLQDSVIQLTANRDEYVYIYTSEVTYENIPGSSPEEKLKNISGEIEANMQLIPTFSGTCFSEYPLNNTIFSTRDLQSNDSVIFQKNLDSKADRLLYNVICDGLAQRCSSDGTFTVTLEAVDYSTGTIDIHVKETYGNSKTLEFRKCFSCRAL